MMHDMCEECWLEAHDGPCPLTLVFATIMPSDVTEDEVIGVIPDGVQVEFWHLPMSFVVMLHATEPFDSRKIVTAFKEWIGSTEPLDDEGWNEDGDV